MPTSVGPNLLSENSLVFSYDTGDIINSYKGAPTINNYGNNFRDFTGTTYGYGAEWTSNPTQFTKTYDANFATPIGPGATLIQESGNNGYHHLSTYGGGEESGAHSISCYVYPIANNITDFNIGMLADSVNTIRFNLVTREIIYGASISNRNAIIQDVPGWPGWLRLGANIEGRPGGWVGCLGYSVYTTYTGTAGARKCYVTGIQYEFQTYITPFVGGTRSVSASLFDISGYNKTINSVSGGYNSQAKIFFNGSNNVLDIGSLGTIGDQYSIECVFNSANIVNYRNVYDMNYSTYSPNTGNVGPRLEQLTSGNVYWIWSGNTTNNALYNLTSAVPILPNRYYHSVFTLGSGIVNGYFNGVLTNSNATSAQGYVTSFQDVKVGRGFVLDPSRFFSGSIDIFKVYNRVLSVDEINSNFNELKTRFNIT